jgi:hypothetical protein
MLGAILHSTQKAIAHVVQDALRAAAKSERQPYGWQFCALIESLEKQYYLKTDLRALEA